MSEFGKALARYRNEAGLNQRQLGAAIDLDPTQVNKVERGHRPPLGAKYMKPLVRALRLNQTQAKDLVQLAGHSPKVLEFQDEAQTPVYPTILRKKGTQPDVYGRRMPPKRREDGKAEEEEAKDAGGKERGGVQPALGRPTQIAASPGTLYHALQSTSHQEVLKHRLAVLEKRLEAAEKNLHEAHEELRELGALAGQDQRPSFAKMLYLQVAGPASDMQSIFEEIAAGNLHGLEVAVKPRESASIFARQTHGYEARLYGTVVFTAHVAEQVAQDYVKSLIEKKFPQSRIEVKVSEDIEPL